MITKIKTIIVTSTLAFALLASAGLVGATTFTPLTINLGYGSTGADVTSLQNFLASNSDIYPSGNVTGYYGPLTEAAVQQYQLSYGISTLGNVGPVTLASINRTMASGYGIDVYGPTIYNVSVNTARNSATINWTASGFAYGKIFYSTSPFAVAEAVGNFTAPTIIGGSNISTAYAQLGQNLTVSNLQAGTQYFYIIEATDASGNVSVTSQSTFTTTY